MRQMMVALAGVVVMGAMSQAVIAQTAPAPDVNLRTRDEMTTQAKGMLAEAKKSPTGLVTVTLEKYPGHYTMLTVRSKDGGAEVHANYSDFLVAEDGEATVMTGGTVVDGKELSPGETRGTKVEGGTPHVMHRGDVIHILPNVPHQTMVAQGKTFTYYVIKVEAPKE